MNNRKLDYQWVFNLSQAYQVLAWYEFDYGDSSKAIPTLISATELANKTVDEDGSSIRFYFNQTTLLNQLSYFYLESNDSDNAKKVIDKAIIIGNTLQQKAPKNLDYQRELAYSYTTAGQLAEQQKDLSMALSFFNQSLKFTQLMYQNDSDNFSTANDYAYDLVHLGMVHEKLSQDQQATKLWNQAIDIMKPVHILEPNNKYYTTTLISALLKAGHYQQAKPLITELKKSGFHDRDFEILLKQHNLK